MSNKKNGLIYLLSNIANAGLSFILLPILTRALTKDDYGKVALFMMVISLMPVFVELCTAGSITRSFVIKSCAVVLTVFQIFFGTKSYLPIFTNFNICLSVSPENGA